MIVRKSAPLSGAERQRRYRASGKERRMRPNTQQDRARVEAKVKLMFSAVHALEVSQPLTREQMATMDWDYLEKHPIAA